MQNNRFAIVLQEQKMSRAKAFKCARRHRLLASVSIRHHFSRSQDVGDRGILIPM